MREQLLRRLAELRADFEAGQKVLAELEAKQTTIQHMLLRIGGAIEVLEEELNKANGQQTMAADHRETTSPTDQA